jgi:hypothetical protein
MVVLNDARSVREILDRRSGSSSDRAPSHINNVVSCHHPLTPRVATDLSALQLIANNNHILLANGTRSSLFRKLWNQTLSTTNVVAHVPLQNAEGIAVLYNTLQNPKDYYKEMRRYSASLTLSIAYGKRATTYDGVDASGFSVAEFYRVSCSSLRSKLELIGVDFAARARVQFVSASSSLPHGSELKS